MSHNALVVGGPGEEEQILWQECQSLRSRLCKAQEDLEALLQIGEAMSTVDFEALLERVFAKLKVLIKAESGGVLLYDPEQGTLELQKPAFGLREEEFAAYALSTAAGADGEGVGAGVRTFLTGEPYICNATGTDHTTNQRIVRMYGIHSSLTVPLKVNGENIGVLHLVNKQDGPFTENDARLLMLLASQLAVVIQNAHLLRQLESKHRLLERSMAIHQELTAAVLQGEDLVTITATLARLIARAVMVEDRFFHLLAAASATGREGSRGKTGAGLPEELLSDERFQTFFVELTGMKKPLRMPEFAWELAGKRLMAPIVAGRKTLGFISIVETEEQLQPLDMVAIQQAATILALKMMQERIAYETEERIKGDFLSDLVTGEYRSEGEVLEKASYFAYDLRRTFQVLVLQVERPKGAEPGRFSRRCLDAARAVVEQQSPRSILGYRGDHLFILAAAQAPVTPLALAGALAQRFSGLRDEAPFLVGVGGVAENLAGIKDSYQEARQAINISRQLGAVGEVVQHGGLGAYRLLLRVQDKQELVRFAEKTLGPLLAYDRERGSNLTETLAYFLGRKANHQTIAEELFIHLNTLKYRLQRIEEICGVDLDNPEHRFNMQLALKVRDIIRAEDK